MYQNAKINVVVLFAIYINAMIDWAGRVVVETASCMKSNGLWLENCQNEVSMCLHLRDIPKRFLFLIPTEPIL